MSTSQFHPSATSSGNFHPAVVGSDNFHPSAIGGDNFHLSAVSSGNFQPAAVGLDDFHMLGRKAVGVSRTDSPLHGCSRVSSRCNSDEVEGGGGVFVPEDGFTFVNVRFTAYLNCDILKLNRF